MSRAGLIAFALATLGGCGVESSREMSAGEVAGELETMRIEPGLWRLTSEVVEVRAPGLPIEMRNRMLGPRSRIDHCITPAQAARPGARFLALRAAGQCRYSDVRFESGRLTGRMRCPDAIAEMDGRYGRRGYVLAMDIASPLPDGATMRVSVRARGQRIGACR